ncbi:hypothetical protein RhiirA1_404022, partial [Rhizophagus irregularis]
MGFAISAEYATGGTLLSELLPKKQRGTILACLNAMWTGHFEENQKTEIKELFSKNYRTRTAFAGLFWGLHVLPYFGMMTFAPVVFASLNLEDEFLSTLISNIFQLFGAVVGVLIMDKIPRRMFVIYSFVILAISIGMLVIIPNPASFVV